jgi:hypothetical protein
MKQQDIPKSGPHPPSRSYLATTDELAAIDDGLTGEPASAAEVEAAFASFRQGIASSLRSSQ